MESLELAERMDCVIDDMGKLIADLRGQDRRVSSFIDPVCWNCSKAYKFYLPDSRNPCYRACKGWLETHTCDYAPRE